jgi:hypothetical protein
MLFPVPVLRLAVIGWNVRQEAIKTHLWNGVAAILFTNQSPPVLRAGVQKCAWNVCFCDEQYPKIIQNKNIAHKRGHRDKLNLRGGG